MTLAAETQVEGAPAVAAAQPGKLRETGRSILRQRSAVIGLVILLTFAFIAIFADQIAPFGPYQDFIGELGVKTRGGPCIHMLGCPIERTEHWFGLDGNARDLYTRVVYGTRISLVIGFLTVGVAIVIGSFLGAIAGFVGGRVDTLIMRLMDVLLVFPALLLAIAIVTVAGAKPGQCRPGHRPRRHPHLRPHHPLGHPHHPRTGLRHRIPSAG